MSRGFSITGQPGFPFIALLCFAVLYLPVATLVFYAFNAGDMTQVEQPDRDLRHPVRPAGRPARHLCDRQPADQPHRQRQHLQCR